MKSRRRWTLWFPAALTSLAAGGLMLPGAAVAAASPSSPTSAPTTSLTSPVSIAIPGAVPADRNVGLSVSKSGLTGRPVVRTDRGLVEGTATKDYELFQGIPYAAPPVGPLRWKAPQPAAAWRGVRHATTLGGPCAQGPGEIPGGTTNEDCLYLNVTSPTGVASKNASEDTSKNTSTSAAKSTTRAKERPRPVIVWVHGGGFTSGAGSNYDARKLAVRGDAVVVTLNYRLGVFGFFAHPVLPGSGTFGLQDQIAALGWVHRNIAAFGGDPHNVTMAGESAGGMSTCAFLTSPAAKGLFDKAIMQSGSCMLNWPTNTWYPGLEGFGPYAPLSEVEDFGNETANELGCTDPKTAVACLRKLPAQTVLGTQMPYNRPAYDTPLLPSDPADALRAGHFTRIPVISGGNRDEGAGNAAALETNGHLTEQAYLDLLTETFGADNGARVAQRYPASAYASPAQAWAAVITDQPWSCPTLTGDGLLAARTTTYAYEFADRTAPNLGAPPPAGFQLGAAHAFDLPYVFDFSTFFDLRPDQQALSDQMIEYWTRFATTGNPNGPGLPTWAPFRAGASTPSVLSFATEADGGVRPVDLAARHRCDLWSSLTD
ncbi:carboxylesterase/lipase family protein [Actinopolymorpha pittospori]